MDASLNTWLRHTFIIQRRNGSTQDLRGNEVPVYVNLNAVKGKFEYLTGSEDTNNREVSIYRQRIIFDAGVSILSKDRVTWPSENRVFEVEAVYIRYGTDGTEHHKVAYVEEIDGSFA